MNEKKLSKLISMVCVVYLVALYGFKCVTYYAHYSWGYGQAEYISFGVYLDEMSWIILVAVFVSIILRFTKLYYIAGVGNLITLCIMIYESVHINNIANCYVHSSFLLSLEFIILVLCIAGDVWVLIKHRTNKTFKVRVTNNNSIATELKEIKELLDEGIISQEEFDAKKKQLLDL